MATVTMPPKIKPRTEAQVSAGDRERRASAHGTPDPFCHLLIGFTYTRCGQRLKPALKRSQSHPVRSKTDWCPNHHPDCPACEAIG
jgi:hypothetical protein